MKPKHARIWSRWLAEELSPGTIKNRMTALRWVAEKIGKDNIIARTNAAYGIPDRVYVTNICKAKELDMDKLEHIRTLSSICRSACRPCSVYAGKSRSRSSRSGPIAALAGAQGFLDQGWARAGDPCPHPGAAATLDEAKALAKGKSLVAPSYATYRDYLQHFRAQCARVGIHAFHGHRHFYAQERYKELTGWECPSRSEPTSKQLTPKHKLIDREAREVISREMGHGREQVTAVYLGR